MNRACPTMSSLPIIDNQSVIDMNATCNKIAAPNDQSPENNPDFATIRLVSRIVLFILKKCWLCCGASVFIIFFIYWYYGSILALCLFFFAASAFLYQLGDWLLYHPDQPPHSRIFVRSPSMVNLPSDNLHIVTADGVRINVVMVKQDSSIFNQVPTILYLHGNAGNIGHRLPNVHGLYHYCGCNILLLEYRGYGHSDGIPTEEGLYFDAQAGLEFLLKHPGIDTQKIVVFGRSLGGAVAIDLASRPEYSGRIMTVIVENTFTSIPDTAKILFNWSIIKWLPVWIFKSQFKSIEKIIRVLIPTLFISGLADAIIPPHMMQELYQASRSKMKQMAVFETGTHNETWQCNGYYRTINLFLDDVMLSKHQNQVLQWPVNLHHIKSEIV